MSREPSREDPHRTLEKLRAGHDVLGGSAPQAPDDMTNDPVEIWARRFGRGLAVLATIALVVYALADVTGALPK